MKQAVNNLEQALKIARESNERDLEGLWLGEIGIANFHLGNTEQAIENIKAAIVILHEIGDVTNEAVHLCWDVFMGLLMIRKMLQ